MQQLTGNNLNPCLKRTPHWRYSVIKTQATQYSFNFGFRVKELIKKLKEDDIQKGKTMRLFRNIFLKSNNDLKMYNYFGH